MRLRTYGLLFTLVLAMVAMSAVPAEAQRDRNELTVMGGASLTDVRSLDSDGGPLLLPPRFGLSVPFLGRSVSLDGSAEFGARYGRRLTSMVTAEADFSMAPGHELEERSGVCPPEFFCIAGPAIDLFAPETRRTTRLVAYHYGGGVRLDLMRGSVRPSIIGGLGAVTYDGSDVTETRLAIRIGGAVAATVGSTIVRVEVVDVIVADHFATGRAEHDVHVRFGLGVRW